MIRHTHIFMALILLPILASTAPARAEFLGQDEIHLTCAVDMMNVCREEGCNRYEYIQSEHYIFKDDQLSICQLQDDGVACEEYVYLSRKNIDPDRITIHAQKRDDAEHWAYIGVNKTRNMWRVISATPPTDSSIGVFLKRMACQPSIR
ncbi:hypothetical protein ACT6QG_09960 [Xanthobacter sp. TB0136]|uniref:hypothetical protein n=1 Tax=Xanthobacter sp. TB0136 TaxID=3459177 RepID=UPI00403A28A0